MSFSENSFIASSELWVELVELVVFVVLVESVVFVVLVESVVFVVLVELVVFVVLSSVVLLSPTRSLSDVVDAVLVCTVVSGDVVAAAGATVATSSTSVPNTASVVLERITTQPLARTGINPY
ncbi:hypothetical protein [Haloarchaeobius sp. DT45]|uniref:hypothetical protein n=1 Tax=Haloarchaeobius sp. DT45 TaxID=3446116 RepID=UPI003F6CE784